MEERLKRQLDFALEIDKEKNVEEKDYYRNKTSNFSLLKGLGTNLLFTILRGESEPERPSHKPKKKKHY